MEEKDREDRNNNTPVGVRRKTMAYDAWDTGQDYEYDTYDSDTGGGYGYDAWDDYGYDSGDYGVTTPTVGGSLRGSGLEGTGTGTGGMYGSSYSYSGSSGSSGGSGGYSPGVYSGGSGGGGLTSHLNMKATGGSWGSPGRASRNAAYQGWGAVDLSARKTKGSSGSSTLESTFTPEIVNLGSTRTSIVKPVKPGDSMPTFTLSDRDKGRVRELRAEALSTPMRSMRQEARRALTGMDSMGSPLAKEAYRGWAEGLGTGISSIASQASLQAEELYGVERAEEISVMLANFNAEMEDYFKQYGQETTTETDTKYGFTTEKGGITAVNISKPKKWGV